MPLAETLYGPEPLPEKPPRVKPVQVLPVVTKDESERPSSGSEKDTTKDTTVWLVGDTVPLWSATPAAEDGRRESAREQSGTLSVRTGNQDSSQEQSGCLPQVTVAEETGMTRLPAASLTIALLTPTITIHEAEGLMPLAATAYGPAPLPDSEDSEWPEQVPPAVKAASDRPCTDSEKETVNHSVVRFEGEVVPALSVTPAAEVGRVASTVTELEGWESPLPPSEDVEFTVKVN